MTPIIIQKEFRIGREPMICASAEAEDKVYKKVVGKSGSIWLIPQLDAARQDLPTEDSGDGVHVHRLDDKDSDGYGGRTLEFLLTDGTIYKAAGPWHSNTEALYKDTGIDLRDKHRTFVVISLDRDFDGYDTIMKDILHIDKEPTIGKFERGKEIARYHADRLNRPVHRYSQSRGGSSCGSENPSSWTAEEGNTYWKYAQRI